MSNSSRRERSNPLLQSSEVETQEAPSVEQRPAAAHSPAPAPEIEQAQDELTTRPAEIHNLDLPPRPPVKRKNQKKLRFGDVYVTRSFSIDKRIAKELDDYMSQGETITSFSNQLFLKILIDAGYDLDPNLFTQPPK